MEVRTNISYKKDAALMSICITASILFMLFTNPNTMSIFLLLCLPALVFISCYFVAKLSLLLFSNFKENKIKTIATILGAGPALIIILGSLGSINFQDILLALLLVGGFSWYIKHFQASSINRT